MKTSMRDEALKWAAWCQRRGMNKLEMFLRMSAPALMGIPIESQQIAELRGKLMAEKLQHQKLIQQLERGEFYDRAETAQLIGKFINELHILEVLRILGCKLIGRKPVR